MRAALYLGPAGSGKTEYALSVARRRATDLARPARLIVDSRAQVRACRLRLARAGGALGLRIYTFAELYLEILQAAGEHPVRLPNPVQVRLVRALLDEAAASARPLEYLSPLSHAPAVPGMLRDLFAELQSAGVLPGELLRAIEGGPARLADLARIYAAYRDRLDRQGWADHATLGTRAHAALAQHPALATDWSLLIVDGVDDFAAVQLEVLGVLARRAESTLVTLTGEPGPPRRNAIYQRALAARERLESALGVPSGMPLPAGGTDHGRAPALCHLERTLRTGARERRPAAPAVLMVAAPDREAEVRTALRWLKSALVRHELAPDQAALIARDLAPYRATIQQIAAEFGLPLSLAGGVPLQSNPAVAALLSLLRLAMPADGRPSSAYPWRGTVEAWRSPYFDWMPLGIQPGDADRLDLVARWANVVSGLGQWRDAFAALSRIDAGSESDDTEGRLRPEGLPTGAEATALGEALARLSARITPPTAASQGRAPCRDYVQWLEDLIGELPAEAERGDPAPPLDDDPASQEEVASDIGLARRAAAPRGSSVDGGPARDLAARDLAARDLAALNSLKDVLRALVWAEEGLSSRPLTPEQFVDDLVGAVDAAIYRPPLPEGRTGLLVASAAEARGLAFEVAALIGLAEGEFPAALNEGPLLRDTERTALNARLGVALGLRTESHEAGLFYSAVTRPRRALLLTRPRIADGGALWQPSPFWEDAVRAFEIEPVLLTSRDRPPASACASWAELWQTVAPGMRDRAPAWRQAERWRPLEAAGISHGALVLRARLAGGRAASPWEGDLQPWGAHWAGRLGSGHLWSVSQLEAYRRCPFSYYVERVLRLQPMRTPEEGPNVQQLGSLFHRMLDALYRHAGEGASLETLLSSLEDVLNPILDAAPDRDGFRPTAWWQRTRAAMLRTLRQTVTALESASTGFRFLRAEQVFGGRASPYPALRVPGQSSDHFDLTGTVDRIDQATDGTLRIVDYKTGDVSGRRVTALARGDDLQIALYALAVERAMQMGTVSDGFYWSVAHATSSPLTLAGYGTAPELGPEAATRQALEHAWEAVHGARSGRFAPEPPPGGCPSFCPATAFCWHYREGYQ